MAAQGASTHLTLYLHNYSFYSQKVLLYLNAKGLTFRTEFINIAKGDQYELSYLKINPRGEVPTIKDGDQVVPDSWKIIEYLEDKYKGKEGVAELVPEDPQKRSTHDALHKMMNDLPADVVTIGSFYHRDTVRGTKLPFILPVRRHMKYLSKNTPQKLRALAQDNPDLSQSLLNKAEFLEKQHGTLFNRESYNTILKSVDAVLETVEKHIAQTGDDKWLFGEELTIADLALATLLTRLSVLGLEHRCWPQGGKNPHLRKYFERMSRHPVYKKSMPTPVFHVKSLLLGITYAKVF